jgi:HK97 family phage prohead protease
MSKQREIRSATMELRSKPGTGNTLTGYIALFNTLSEDLGGFVEILAPNAFSSSLDSGRAIRALVNHNTSACVGNTASGTLRLSQDSKGLAFEIDLPDTTAARDLRVSVDRQDVTGCSFGFITLEDSWAVSDLGQTIRTLLDVDLYECSVGVTFPAYGETTSELRSRFPDGAITPPQTTKAEKRSNENGCDCDCPECLDDDCADCSDPDCDDPNCEQQRTLRNADDNMRLALDIALAQ